MKLIIDIPEKNFIKDDLIRFFGCYSQKLDEVIKNGTPLDKIRAEIDNIKIYGQIDEHNLFVRSADGVKEMALNIIDKYKNEVNK